jgi:tetratricopeptide (TPR) repeat protein
MTSSKAYAVALAVALAASAASVANGFVYDDQWVIRDNPQVHSLHHPAALVSAPLWPATFRTNAYRPSTTLLFAVDWAVGAGRPFLFHATNVALHLFVVALVLALAGRVLEPAGGGALVAALWFAVQPVHVEAVANGVGLSELLAAAAYLAALLAYLADGDAAEAGAGALRRGLLSLAVLGAAAVAYGAKESAITLPLVLLLADLWVSGRAGHRLGEGFRRHWILWLGVAVLAMGYLAARAHVLGPGFGGGAVALGLEGRSLPERVLIMAPAVLVWLRWLVWPMHLSADYLPDVFVPGARLGLAQLAGLAVLGLAAWAAWAARRRRPGVTAGIVFGAATATVASNIVVPTGVLLAERLAYLPSVGAALVVGALWQTLPRSRYLWPATVGLLALLAVRSLLRIPVWHDQTRFVQALLRDAPASCRTHWAMGDAAFAQGARGTGESEMQLAIRICQGDADLIQALGKRYLDAGLYAPADRYLTEAYRLDTLQSSAAVQAVLARVRGGRADAAESLGAEAVRRFPEAAEVLGSAEQAYLAAGKPREALALARRLVFLNPGAWLYQQVAAYAAAVNGRCDEARARLERAVALAPSEPGPRALLGRLASGSRCGMDRS